MQHAHFRWEFFFFNAAMKQSMDYALKERIERSHCRIRKIANIKDKRICESCWVGFFIECSANKYGKYQTRGEKKRLDSSKCIPVRSLRSHVFRSAKCTLIYLFCCAHNSVRKFHFSPLSSRHQQYDCRSRAHSKATQLFFQKTQSIHIAMTANARIHIFRPTSS